jgi:hypothetical protein
LRVISGACERTSDAHPTSSHRLHSHRRNNVPYYRFMTFALAIFAGLIALGQLQASGAVTREVRL